MIQAPHPITIDVLEPHSAIQAAIMRSFMNPHLREVWVCCGNKFGKTTSAATALSIIVPRCPGAVFRWIAPVYSQARIGMQLMQKMMPKSEFDLTKSPPILRFPKIEDTEIQFYHGQDPESIEGVGARAVVLDEASKLKERVYVSVKTTVAFTKGPILGISTPRGRNWFKNRCDAAMDEMLRAKHEGRPPTMLFFRARSIDNPSFPKESAEDALKNLPNRLYRQHFLAEFVEDGAVFLGMTACIYGEPLLLNGESESEFWFDAAASETTVVVGADWAKTTDRTVFIAICTQTRKVVGFHRFYKKPYTEAIRNLVRFCKKFKEVEIVMHDKTGVGQAIDDQLVYTDLPFRGVTFTNAMKTELVNRLITSVEQREILIPNWQTLIDEMDSFEVSTSSVGNMIYEAAEGEHDDTVIALCLAHSGLLEYGERNMEVRNQEDLVHMKSEPSELEKYYNSLSSDDDYDN